MAADVPNKPNGFINKTRRITPYHGEKHLYQVQLLFAVGFYISLQYKCISLRAFAFRCGTSAFRYVFLRFAVVQPCFAMVSYF